MPGLASPVLALLAVVLAGYGRARAAVLLVVAALALAVSFPNHTPLFDWLRHLPLFGDFRFPFRYRLISMLAHRGVRRHRDLAHRDARRAARRAAGDRRRHDRGGAARGADAGAFDAGRERLPARTAAQRPAASSPARHQERILRSNSRSCGGRTAMRSRSYWRAFGTDRIGRRKGLLAAARPRAALARDDRPHADLLRGRRRGRRARARRRSAAARLEPYSRAARSFPTTSRAQRCSI